MKTTTKKKDLKKEISDLTNLIKSNAKDAKLCDTQLKKLLSLKGQMDVEEVQFVIPLKDVIKEYDFDTFSIINCKSGIMFKVKGGFHSFVTPRMTALHGMLIDFLYLKDNYDELNDELKKSYDYILTAITYIFNAPIYAPTNDEFFFGIAGDIAKRLNKLCSDLSDKIIREETYKENAEFENTQDALNEVVKD